TRRPAAAPSPRRRRRPRTRAAGGDPRLPPLPPVPAGDPGGRDRRGRAAEGPAHPDRPRPPGRRLQHARHRRRDHRQRKGARRCQVTRALPGTRPGVDVLSSWGVVTEVRLLRLRRDGGWVGEAIPAGEPPVRRLGLLVLLVPVLQVTVVAGLPFGVDLVMLVAVVAGLAFGPVTGSVTGFAVGLVADVVPPAVPPAGRTALVLCLAGYACGLLTRLPVLARVPAGVLVGAVAVAAPGGWWPAPAPPPFAALPYTLSLASVVWVLLTRRRRDPYRIMRSTDAKSITLPPAAGARDGGASLPDPARTPVAGADH